MNDMSAASSDAIKESKIRDWIGKNVGGDIERFEQQPRWRGGWWVDVRKDGTLLKLYVREERKEDFPPWPLEHEAGTLQVLEKYQVPVPHIYGICEDPHATVMDNLPGAFDFSKVSAKEGLAVLNDFAEVVARQHAIPPQELVKLGIKMPKTPEEISLGCFKACEAMYLKGKKLPEPRIEFFRQWIYRNVPKHRRKVSILAVDSGQFLFENGKVTGLYDFEYACLGDPMIDLAFIPLRLSSYNLTDSRPFFRRYAEITGETYDIDILTFHAVWWALCTPFILTANMHQPPGDATYFEYIGWYVGTMLSILQLLNDAKGLNLGIDIDLPEPKPSRWSQIFDVMTARVPPEKPGEPYEFSERRRFLTFAKRMDACPDVEAGYFRDVERITGRTVGNWLEADTELEKFVLNAGPEHDNELIGVFHRWAVAQARMLLQGLAQLPMVDGYWPRFSDLIT